MVILFRIPTLRGGVTSPGLRAQATLRLGEVVTNDEPLVSADGTYRLEISGSKNRCAHLNFTGFPFCVIVCVLYVRVVLPPRHALQRMDMGYGSDTVAARFYRFHYAP